MYCISILLTKDRHHAQGLKWWLHKKVKKEVTASATSGQFNRDYLPSTWLHISHAHAPIGGLSK